MYTEKTKLYFTNGINHINMKLYNQSFKMIKYNGMDQMINDMPT